MLSTPSWWSHVTNSFQEHFLTLLGPRLLSIFEFVLGVLIFHQLLLRLKHSFDTILRVLLGPNLEAALVLCSSVYIDHKHDLYPNVLAWASQQFARSNTRELAPLDPSHTNEEMEDTTYFYYEGKSVARLQPDFGTYIFWDHGRPFLFERKRHYTSNPGGGVYEESARVATLGWSWKPIERILRHIAGVGAPGHLGQQTKIWTLRSPEERKFWGSWQKMGKKPSRPLETVVLERKEKNKILDDMSQFLARKTELWYERKGIPWRRGYLFHGIPGAGKTTLAFALSGHFDMDVYVVNLADQDLGDSDLVNALGRLPRRSMLLLEDIDATFIGQNRQEYDNDKQGTQKFVSLAALLNALDGVTSTEGRILIMTTNHLEQLDPALTRPGRIDRDLEFTHVKKDEIQKMFTLLYEDHPDYTEELAVKFADKVPNGEYSSAAIQGFLIRRMMAPYEALKDVDEWCTGKV
jgi:chaperone BCS1